MAGGENTNRTSFAGGVMADTVVDETLNVADRFKTNRWDTASIINFGFFLATMGLTLYTLATPGRMALPGITVVGWLIVITWAIGGVITARRTPPLALLVTLGTFFGAGSLAAARVSSLHSGDLHSLARSTAIASGFVVIAFSVHCIISLPDGRLATSGRQLFMWAAYLGALGTGVSFGLADRVPSSPSVAFVWAVALAVAVLWALPRYRESSGGDRARMQWLGIGALSAGSLAGLAGVLHLLVTWPHPVVAVAAASTLLIPLGLLAASTSRLAGAGERLLLRALSVAGFTVVVSTIYLIVVLGFGSAPSNSADRRILGLSMVAGALAALVYVLLRSRLMARSSGFVYSGLHAPDEVLRTFGTRMTRDVPMDELLLQLAESLKKTMVLKSAEIFAGLADVLERAASVPDVRRPPLFVSGRERQVVARAGVSGTAWVRVWIPSLLDGRGGGPLRVAPISHGGDLLGLIVVERPDGASPFSDAEDAVLAELARQVGLALHNVELDSALQTSLDEIREQAVELRASRARIVASADAERRRVERDLHDGAQQHLVALAVNLRLARDMVADDPAGAAEMLDGIAGDVKAAVQELRDLAHGIYPPLLVDSGLPEALRAAGNRSPLAVTVTHEGVGRYAPAIEAAVYFCCLEALQNAGKHAPGAQVEVRVWEQAGGLLFTVSDDGPGYDAARTHDGHGYVNMSDRLGAIGGSVRWTSIVGQGSSVSGSIPL
jgi:signal transduction histidine kinase